jgi:hypothetical protein
MRILHVVPSYLPAVRYGGPIFAVHGLCRALAKRGHEVQVFTTNIDGPGISPTPIGTPVDLDGIKNPIFFLSPGQATLLGTGARPRTSSRDREAECRTSSFCFSMAYLGGRPYSKKRGRSLRAIAQRDAG